MTKGHHSNSHARVEKSNEAQKHLGFYVSKIWAPMFEYFYQVLFLADKLKEIQ